MEKTFEQSLTELEGIVQKLEEGDRPLEESLKLFEQGVRLSRECQARLQNAERRIQVLMQDGNGELGLTDLNETAADEKPVIKRITFDGD